MNAAVYLAKMAALIMAAIIAYVGIFTILEEKNKPGIYTSKINEFTRRLL